MNINPPSRPSEFKGFNRPESERDVTSLLISETTCRTAPMPTDRKKTVEVVEELNPPIHIPAIVGVPARQPKQSSDLTLIREFATGTTIPIPSVVLCRRKPKTKVEAKICARKVVTFKPSLKAKNKLNAS